MHNGRIILIGVGTAKHGALAKRLSDYRRPSSSGRRCRSGQYVYGNRHLLTVEVIVIGTVGDNDAIRQSKQLKQLMIERHKPELNAPANMITHRTSKVRASVVVPQKASACRKVTLTLTL